jgi:hypothetical protein
VRFRAAVVAFAALVVVASIGMYTVWRRAGVPPLRLPLAHDCVIDAGGEPGFEAVNLDAEQAANAATISAVGIRRGVPQRAIVIALATAFQESKLRNLAAGDRDSIGLFQQRPSQGWGKPEQIADPRYAAGRFYTALLKVRGWDQMRVTEAAQKVQRSRYPEAYQKWADASTVLARALGGDVTAAVACTVPGEPSERGPAAATALTEGVRLDWGNVSAVATTEVVGLTLTARDQKAGWQYAHWLVAHAADLGVRRVRYGDREWTARDGTWTRVSGFGPGAAERVVAEVVG